APARRRRREIASLSFSVRPYCLQNLLPSWPGLSRPSASWIVPHSEDVDARRKAGHDEFILSSTTSSPERHLNLLAAAHHGDAPQPAAFARHAFEVFGLVDLGAVDGKNDIALLESDIGSG